MAVSTKVVGFACPASTGAFAVTGVGFQPKAVVLLSIATAASLPATVGDGRLAFGVGVSSTDRRSMFTSSGGGVGWWVLDNATVIKVANIQTVTADLTSMDADGFTLNVTQTLSGMWVTALCIGGSGVTAKTGAFARATTVGTQAITGVGFQPSVVIFFQPNIVTATGSARATVVQQIGWTTGPTGRGASSLRQTNNVNPSETKVGQTTSGCIQSISTTGITTFADCQSLDSDGFTLNWTTVAATAALVYYLALGGVSATAGAFNQPASDSSQTVSTGTTSAEAVLLLSDNAASSGSVVANGRQSLGVFTSTDQHALGQFTPDNIALASEHPWSFYSRTQALRLATEGTTGLNSVGDATVTTVASDSFTLAWTNTDGTQREVLYLALGEQTANLVVPQGVLSLTGRAPLLAHRINLPSEP